MQHTSVSLLQYTVKLGYSYNGSSVVTEFFFNSLTVALPTSVKLIIGISDFRLGRISPTLPLTFCDEIVGTLQELKCAFNSLVHV